MLPLRRYERDIILFGGILEKNSYGIQSRRNSGSVILYNVTLKDDYYGVYTYTGSSFSLELYDCILCSNSFILYFRYSSALKSIILRRCTLTENYRIIYDWYHHGRSFTLDVSECSISRSQGFVVDFDKNNGDISFKSNTFVKNSQTVLRIQKDSSFETSRSSILITKNIFANNSLSPGHALIDFAGKEIGTVLSDVNGNTFMSNECSYVVKMYVPSNWAPGLFLFTNNSLVLNKGLPFSAQTHEETSVRSFSVGFLGCFFKHVKIQRNLFNNKEMDKELFVGFTCGSDYTPGKNDIVATLNYWGTSIQVKLRDRIFHFENWNDRPYVRYLPAAATPNFADVITTQVFTNISTIGGYVDGPLRLMLSRSPYIVVTDLTISANATLEVEPGVQIYFKPNIGLLVLGDIIAHGTTDKEIKFCSLGKKCESKKTVIRLVNGEEREHKGILEILVGGKWLSPCYNYFTSKDGSVACRELGYGEYSNHRTVYNRKFVPEYKVSFNCRGNETSLSNCKNQTVNYCRYYFKVYLECEYNKWGNIRIVLPKSSNSSDYNEITGRKERSSLQNIFIHDAGYLHNVDVPSLQVIERSPFISHIRIIQTNGIEIIGQKNVTAFEHIYVEHSPRFPSIAILDNQGSISISRITVREGKQYGIVIAPMKNMTFQKNFLGQHNLCNPMRRINADGKIYVFLNERSKIKDIFCSLEVISPNNTVVHFRLLHWERNSYSMKVYSRSRSLAFDLYSWNTNHYYLDRVTAIRSNGLIIEATILTLRRFLAEITFISETGIIIIIII